MVDPTEYATINRGAVQLPPDSEIVTDADEEAIDIFSLDARSILLTSCSCPKVFLLYSNLQTRNISQSGSAFRGLGHVDSRKDVLTIKIELTPQPQTIHLDSSSQNKKPRTSRKAQKVRGDKTIEIELAQDKTALHSRKGDTGSVLWKAR
jgi:hypothetical protein